MDADSLEILSSVRRTEIKSKAVFSDGFYHEIGPAFLGGSEAVPDPHFNRISILQSGKLDKSLLDECIKRMVEGNRVFIDLPFPVSDEDRRLLRENGYHMTGESRSSMALTGADSAPAGGELDISLAENQSLDVFLELFLRGFQTPEDLIPFARDMFHGLVPRNCGPANSRLYLGSQGTEPAATLYLFYEATEGGINMVSTREDMRRKGFATTMLRRAIADARAMGVRILGLETRWNSAPERLYSKLGFSTIARHEVFTNTPDLKYGL
ncbi:GNAT family N-acetyltransferase [Candidatus Poribacteria bacterium]|nr:GNAT family N-acetyltransferase [Candidatus Poribacteria bacterium]